MRATFTSDGKQFKLLCDSPTHSCEHFGTDYFVDKGDRCKSRFQPNRRLFKIILCTGVAFHGAFCLVQGLGAVLTCSDQNVFVCHIQQW